MSNETNAANIRRGFEEGINGRKLEVFHELLDARYINHSMPAPIPGPDGFNAVVGAFLAAFPDMNVVLEHVLADGDFVSTYGYYTGTQTGDFMGIPATGKSVKVQYSDLWRLENGLAVENWVVMDNLGMMQQLGVIPSPEAAATAS